MVGSTTWVSRGTYSMSHLSHNSYTIVVEVIFFIVNLDTHFQKTRVCLFRKASKSVQIRVLYTTI
jgi:hypothetical protein